jgi:CHRD domain-containing protein
MKFIASTALFAGLLSAGLVLSVPSNLAAQSTKTYRARLSPVPIDQAMMATIAGTGSATAVLNGSKLTVTGTFDGLKSPATIVQIHRGQRGVRGPAVLDLLATKAASGQISGTVELNPQQLQDLQNARLYIQLHSEKAADGNLWGWLMPQETKR